MQNAVVGNKYEHKHLWRAFVDDSVPFVQALGCLQCHQYESQVTGSHMHS